MSRAYGLAVSPHNRPLASAIGQALEAAFKRNQQGDSWVLDMEQQLVVRETR